MQYAVEYELWELAAALNLDLVETQQDRTVREIDEAQKAYYEETREQVGPSGLTRQEVQARAAERRRERQANR